MAYKYADVAKDLRRRMASPDPEWEVGSQIPTLSELQDHYRIGGSQTIRSALGILVEEGLIETRQGRGAFVVRIPEPTDRDRVLDELRQARAALSRAIAELENE